MKTEYCEDPAMQAEKMVYTVNEAAIMLNVHPNTIYKLVKQKAFNSRKIGSEIRISKTSFDRWLTINN